MKQKIFVIFILLVVIAAGLFVFQMVRQPKRVKDLESIISDDAIQYVYSYNLRQKVDDFCNSEFYQKIKSLPFYETAITPELQKKKEVLSFLSEFLNEDFAFVSFSSGKPRFQRSLDSAQVKMGQYLFLARASQSKNIKKQIADLYLSFTDKENVNFSEYKGIKLTEWKTPKSDITLVYALLADVLVLGNDIAFVKKSIDLFKKESTDSLANDALFREITKGHLAKKNDSLAWFYINYENYLKDAFSDIDEQYSELSLPGSENIDFGGLFNLVKSIAQINKGAVIYFDYDQTKSGIMAKSYQFFDKSKDEYGLLDYVFSSKGIDKEFLKLVPYNIIMYFGFSGNLMNYYNSLEKMFSAVDTGEKKTQVGSLLQNTDIFSQIDFKNDLLPLFADNFGIMFSGFEQITPQVSSQQVNPFMQMAFPLPKISLYFKLKDPNMAKESIDSIVQQIVDKANESLREKISQELQRRIESLDPQQREAYLASGQDPMAQLKEVEVVKRIEKKYKGVEATSIEIQNSSITPTYFYLDKYLIISLSFNDLREMANVSEDSYDSFASYSEREYLTEKMLPSYSTLYFVNFSGLIEKIRETMIFKMLIANVAMKSGGKISVSDVDSIMDVLDDISLSVQTTSASGDESVEGMFYIQIEGL